MAVARVIIQATGGSPLRVSVAGVDASLAEFDNLLFDANQQPLRLAQNTYMQVALIPDANNPGQNIAETTGPPVAVTYPAGTTPLFLVAVRQPYQTNVSGGYVFTPGTVRTPGYYVGGLGPSGDHGGGGAICSGYFIGVTCSYHNQTGPNEQNIDRHVPTLVNFAIFKNYM